MTDIRESFTYDAPVDAVIGMFGDSGATVARYESLGHRDVKIVECDAQSESLRVVCSRVVDVDLPSFAKKVLKPTNTMCQTDEWRRRDDGSWQGTWDVDVQGAPVRISGTMKLASSDGKTLHEIGLRVEVKVPIVGGRIADWVAKGDARRSLAGEFRFNDGWLREHA
jgi:uncharacterized protein DUF2505